MRILRFCCLLFLALGLICLPQGAFAVNLPDSGRLLGDIQQQPRLVRPQPLPEIQLEQPKQGTAETSGINIEVKAFHLSGNQHIATVKLQPIVDANAGKTLNFAGLQQVISDLNGYYRQHGFLTTSAYFPAQDVSDGNVRIQIVEGRLADAGIKLNANETMRLDSNRALQILYSAISAGGVLTKQEVERGILLLNDLPGISASSSLAPGDSVGTSELLIEVKEGKLVSGSLEGDNFGGRYTGKWRGSGTINLNNPAGHGDQAGLHFTTSQDDMFYLRGHYQHPVGFYGTQLGAAFTYMNYALGREFEDNDIEGESTIYNIYLTHPVTRSRAFNLSFTANFDLKQLEDQAADITTSERDIMVASFELRGNITDQLHGVGVTGFGITLVQGDLDLSGVKSTFVADNLSTKSDGNYTLISANISHTRYLPHNFSVYAAAHGQVAFDNLDSSEKLSLGGAGAIRAYAQGEANGDEGYIVNLELRYDHHGLIPKHQLQSYLFIDHGRIRQNHNTWNGWQGSNPDLNNSYNLSGAGIGFALSKSSQYFIRTSYGWTIGSNDGEDVKGHDSEGQCSSGQFWVQGSWWF